MIKIDHGPRNLIDNRARIRQHKQTIKKIFYQIYLPPCSSSSCFFAAGSPCSLSLDKDGSSAVGGGRFLPIEEFGRCSMVFRCARRSRNALSIRSTSAA